MPWIASLPPLYVTIIAIAALVSTRKIVVAWLANGRRSADATEPTFQLLARMDARLAQLESQVTTLSDELAATRTEFRALARTTTPPALGVGTDARQSGGAHADSADPQRSMLSP